MITNVWQLLGWLAWVLETGWLAYLSGAGDADDNELPSEEE